jgi:RNA binding exosome subunit
MTVYETIREWLNKILLELQNEFPHSFTAIEPEKIPLEGEYGQEVEFQAGGIFSSPQDITTTLMAGQVKHTEFKSFYLRRPFDECESRVENERFFERLKEIIYEKNLRWDMPEDGRKWKSIEINSGVYPANIDTASLLADYLVPLKLVYTT